MFNKTLMPTACTGRALTAAQLGADLQAALGQHMVPGAVAAPSAAKSLFGIDAVVVYRNTQESVPPRKVRDRG